ncbi:hypothetical protein ISN44_As09g028590 [Arabidopsis suecica]|uniref:Uncharacterized protein n=1 Tax=Arabidopsis suecica TaxID=45249 RepID=A0A8T2ALH5_ARASU|nr:hypothetical protein ISN44_As09g028590 [Arabidopsis suecica]
MINSDIEVSRRSLQELHPSSQNEIRKIDRRKASRFVIDLYTLLDQHLQSIGNEEQDSEEKDSESSGECGGVAAEEEDAKSEFRRYSQELQNRLVWPSQWALL